jgi:hypothetical protein
MLVKTPVGALLLVAGGMAAVALPRCRLDLVSELALLLPIAVFFLAISSQTGLQYLRYMLPIYPYLFICAGRLGRLVGARPAGWIANPSCVGGGDAERRTSFGGAKSADGGRIGNPSYAGALLLVLLIAWNAVSVLRVHPHYLAYFNEPAGGPPNALSHLADSNIDWGQGLIALRDWLEEHAPGQKVELAYFGTMYPEVLGIDYELPPFGPEALTAHADPSDVGPTPGLHAISANFLVGVPFPAPNAEGRQTGVPLRAYTYYNRFEPIATPGWSIYVYDLTLEEANHARREMGLAELK